MDNIKLSKRLELVAGFVRQGSVLADIGTDHGYLVCKLALDQIITKGYACDINPLPLHGAKNTIAEYGLDSKVETVLADGLNGLESRGITDIAIAGMGGELIFNIVNNANWVKDSKINLILQPMSRDYKLRTFLYSAGFEIVCESAVKCGKYYYTAMQVKYTGAKREIPPTFAWGGLLWGKSDEYSIGYLKSRYNLLKQKEPSFVEGDGYREMLEMWKERFENA